MINNHICLVAGKSAGHILPAITLVQNLKAQDPHLFVSFISNQTALDYQALSHNPVINQHLAIDLMPIPTRKLWLLPKFSWQLMRAIWQTYRYFKNHRPNQIISTGGLIAIPVCLVAKHFNIAITIYELNVIPGKATKFLAKIANQTNICFQQTQAYLPGINCTVTTYPNRFKASDYDLTQVQALALIKLKNANFNAARKTILILGGSQGSLFINELICKFINQNPNIAQKIQIIHQTGSNDQTNWPNFYDQYHIPAIVFSYDSNLMPYYKLADLIICRSGAGSLAEILPLKTACITIPLQTNYTSHQLQNAQAIAQENSWIKLFEQSALNHDFDKFSELVKNILTIRN